MAFGVNALSFFISALCVLPILWAGTYEKSTGEKAAEAQTKYSSVSKTIRAGVAELREGLEVIIKIPWLWVTILVFGVLNIMESSPRSVALPFLIKDDLGANVAVLGYFGSAFSLGFVFSALWLGQYPRLRRRGLLGYLPIMLNGFLLLLFGFKAPIPILIGAMFIYGVCFYVL